MDKISSRLRNVDDGNIIWQVIHEHIFFHKQIVKLAGADLQKNYRGAALGWAWALIKPAVTIFVYWFAFEIGLRRGGPVTVHGVDYPFFLWMLAGIIPWFYLSEMLSPGTDCIRKYSYLVTKMNFPVSTIPTFVSISRLLVNLLLQIPCLIIFWMSGFPPDIYLLQMPVYILFIFYYATAQTLLFSLLATMSKDFSNLIKSLTTALFWLSAIMWNIDTVKQPWLKTLLRINPITYVVTGFRNIYVNKRWFFEEKTTLYFLVVSTVFFLAALLIYKKVRKDIPDVL